MRESSIPSIVAARREPGDGSAPWKSPLASLPWDIEDILKCAAGDAAALDAASKTCGTRPVVAESACRWFIRHVLFRQGASYYWNLGVERDASIDLIRAHYRHLISIFHPDRLPQSDEREWYESFAKRVNEAYNTLKNSEMRLRYDRVRNSEQPQRDRAPSRAGDPNRPSGAGATSPSRGVAGRPRIFARATWRNAPTPGGVSNWLETRRPVTLKTLAFGAVLALAFAAVLLTRARKDPPIDVVMPRTMVAPVSIGTDVELKMAELINDSPQKNLEPVDTKATKSTNAIRAATTRAEDTTALASPMPVPLVMAVPQRQEERAAVPAALAVATMTASANSREKATPSGLDPPQNRAVMPAVVTRSAADPQGHAEPTPEITQPPPMQGGLTTVPIIAKDVTATDVDLVVARFVRAYDDGDFGALMSLIDPDVVHDDRMAFTMAKFNRVFRETSSRSIEFREINRSQDNGRAKVQLEARTAVVGQTAGQRIDAGQLMLVVRRRGAVPVIVELQYRDNGAG